MINQKTLLIAVAVWFVANLPTSIVARSAENLSFKKPARQSSLQDPKGGPEKAVDGNRNQQWTGESITHTNADNKAYWEVDLGAIFEISKVVIYNREDGWGNRLDRFYLMISSAPFPASGFAPETGDGIFRQYFEKAPSVNEIPISNVKGRYVRIQLKGQNYLSLAEVEVFGK